MLTGVGPSEHPSRHDIPFVHTPPLPGVGQHLIDHITFNVNFKAMPGQSLVRFLSPNKLRDMFSLIKGSIQYNLFATGILNLHSQEAMAFVRTTDLTLLPLSKFNGEFEDTTPRPGSPDLEIMVSPQGWRVRDVQLPCDLLFIG